MRSSLATHPTYFDLLFPLHQDAQWSMEDMMPHMCSALLSLPHDKMLSLVYEVLQLLPLVKWLAVLDGLLLSVIGNMTRFGTFPEMQRQPVGNGVCNAEQMLSTSSKYS